jgi:CRISPR-associated protein Csb2
LATETLPVAEAARRYLMGIHKSQSLRAHYGGRIPDTLPDDAPRPRSAVFSGKDGDGRPLRGHGHAYCLPADEDRDGRLDHLTLVARDGFDRLEQRALDKLRGFKTDRRGEESHSLRTLLLGMGTLAEVSGGPLGPARVWESATPYLATRFAKTRGRDKVDLRSPEQCRAFLAADLLRQIRDVIPDVDAAKVRVEPMLDPNGVFTLGGRRPIEFKRFRRKRADDGGRRLAGAFRLTFPEPVVGPVCLGHSAHFGLGLFLPALTGDT